jgi:hypothetical protein
MNNEEAMFILRAFRPGAEDAADPRFHEALEQARRDPELGRWFADECALDVCTGAKLRAATRPPADLKAMLLAQRRIVRPAPWWRQPALWMTAAAACLALIVTLSALWPKPSPEAEVAVFREAMARVVGGKPDRLDLMSPDLGEVRRWLTQADAHGDFVLPGGLGGKSSLGCRVLDWKGHRVALICFELADRRMAHLLVVDRGVFRDRAPELPQFAGLGDLGTMTWNDGNRTYLLASHGASEEQLLQLL